MKFKHYMHHSYVYYTIYINTLKSEYDELGANFWNDNDLNLDGYDYTDSHYILNDFFEKVI